jgi:hypothetical protein
MLPIQNFNEKSVGHELWEALKAPIVNRYDQIKQFNEEYNQSQAFFSALWRAKLNKAVYFLTNDEWNRYIRFMQNNWHRIGTYEFYLQVFYELIGYNSDVAFQFYNEDPGILGVNIIQRTHDIRPLVDEDDNEIVYEDESGIDAILTEEISLPLTEENLNGILTLLKPSGLFFNLTITAE